MKYSIAGILKKNIRMIFMQQHKRKIMPLLIVLILVGIFQSCVSHKKLTSMEGLQEGNQYESHLTEYLVQTGDMLDIAIKNPDPEQVEIFLSDGAASSTGTTQMGGATVYLRSYIVDDSGMVVIPLAGSIYVRGLSLSQVSDTISVVLGQYLKHHTVVTKLLSFRVSILGEVRNPGTQYIYAPSMNIYQALAMAGDVTDLGNKNKIKVVRTENFKSVVYVVDLDDPMIITSEVFYVKSNDLIYVEPLRMKSFRMNASSIAIGLSFVTLALTILTLVR